MDDRCGWRGVTGQDRAKGPQTAVALPGAVVRSLAQQDPETGQAGFGCAKSLPRGRGLDEGPVPWGGGRCRSRRPSVLTSGSRPGGRGPRVLPRPPDASISGPDTGVTSLLVRFAVEAQVQSMGRMLRTESFLANRGNRPQWAGREAAGSNVLLLGEKTHRECSRWGAGGAWPMGVHRCGPHT